MFEIKICGVKSTQEIECVAAAGSECVSAIGLNFFPPSVRYVDPSDATVRDMADLSRKLGVFSVGVFVNQSVAAVRDVYDRVGLDVAQLHGDEPVSAAQNLIASEVRVARAVKLPKADLTVKRIESAVQEWAQIGCHLLLDVDAGAAHGGSGTALDWAVVGEWARQNPAISWTLAGGLNPGNVAEAISQSGAKSVDTASGVESERGVKSADLIADFFKAARFAC